MQVLIYYVLTFYLTITSFLPVRNGSNRKILSLASA